MTEILSLKQQHNTTNSPSYPRVYTLGKPYSVYASSRPHPIYNITNMLLF